MRTGAERVQEIRDAIEIYGVPRDIEAVAKYLGDIKPDSIDRLLRRQKEIDLLRVLRPDLKPRSGEEAWKRAENAARKAAELCLNRLFLVRDGKSTRHACSRRKGHHDGHLEDATGIRWSADT